MPNKKINALDVRTAVSTDLMLVGDPATGTAYKSTLATLPLVPTSRTITINGVSQDLSANRTYTIDALPSQTGNSGKYLTTNGTIASWDTIVGMGIGNAITSATAGSVLFAGTSGVLQQDNANLFWDDTNNRLGIGTNTINASAKVQIDSTTSGFLKPKMTTTQRDAITSPATGLQVYNTTTNTNDTYNGTSWISEGNVSGSGVANQLTYWNGTGSVTGSTGLTYVDTTGVMTLSKNQNATTGFTITNTTSGLSSVALLTLNLGGLNLGYLGKYSSTSTGYKFVLSNDLFLSTGTGDIAFQNDSASGKIKFGGGGSSTAQMTLTAAGRLLLGTTSEGTFILDVNGTARVSGEANIQGLTAGTGNSSPLGNSNTSFGYQAGFTNTTTPGLYGNTAFGYQAGRVMSTGYSNVYIGYQSGVTHTTAQQNVGIGDSTFRFSSPTINQNVAIGAAALLNATGNGNLALGTSAGAYRNAGNVDLGNNAGSGASFNGSGNICIGSESGKYSGDFKLYIASSPISNGNLIYGDFVTGQLKINNSNTLSLTASAQFEVVSTTRGFLPPRMTTTQINAIATPAEGLQIYNTTISHMCFYQAGSWQKINHSPM
jgi:hypothetical protein